MKLDTYPNPDSGDGPTARYPKLGIVPRSPVGRLFLAWAAINIVLTLLPVFNVLGNSNALGASGMPTTVFYSYAVFTLNCFLGAAYFLTRGLSWVKLSKMAEAEDAQ